MYMNNKHYKAVYDNLWDYFKVLKTDGDLRPGRFNDADCKHLTEAIIKQIDQVDMDEHADHIAQLEVGQEFNESFEERKQWHER